MNKFIVSSAGNLTATDASFTGSIKSGSTISGATISGGTITIGDTKITSGKITTNEFKLGNNDACIQYVNIEGETRNVYMGRVNTGTPGNAPHIAWYKGNQGMTIGAQYKSGGMDLMASVDDKNQTYREGIIFYKSGSSKRYKNFIDKDTEAEAKRLLDLPIIHFVYKPGYLIDSDENSGRVMTGIFAEDVAELFPDAVYHVGNQVENYTDRQLLVRLIKLCQIQQKEIDELKQRL